MADKPFDRWLSTAGIAVGIALFLVPKTSVVIILFLLLMFALLIHPAWNAPWIEDSLWRQGASLIALIGLSAFIGWAAWPLRPTVLYFVPGLIMSDNETRTLAQQFDGDSPLINVSVSITDADALNVAKADESTARFYFSHYFSIPFLQAAEIDPRSNGLQTFDGYRPFKLGNERLIFDIKTRDMDARELMQVYQDRPHTFPAYYLNITNSRSGRPLTECISDSRYIEYDRTKANLPLCCGGSLAPCQPWYVKIHKFFDQLM